MASSFDLGAAFGSLTEQFLKLPLLQKILFPILAVGTVWGLVTITRMASKDGYAVLYSDLAPTDSAAVIARLKEQKIAYQIRGDGSTVAISPSDMVHELRISLASEGIPKGGRVGWELFDVSNLGTTTLQEKIKMQRALQGELERTISSMDAVRDARVAIATPERRAFGRQATNTTASVLLMLRPGGELNKRQVRGIANLVAGSVEGLERDNVTIVDIYGTLLTPDEDEQEGLGADATRLQFKQQIERSYVQRIEEMLAKVVGPGKVVARVTANLDFSLNEQEEEIFDPGGQVIRSEREVERGDAFTQRGGIPGVVSNLAEQPDPLAPPGGNAHTSGQRESVRNYEVSRAVRRVSAPRGRLINLSVAVLVDRSLAGNGVGEGAESGAVASLDPEFHSQIEALVRSAVGFDSLRGDTLTVENMPFFSVESPFAAELERQAEFVEMMRPISSAAVPIVFIILFFLLLVRPMVKFLTRQSDAEVDLSRLLPTGIEELEQELAVEKKRARIPDYEPQIDMDQLNELIADNCRVVKENPEQAALLIRYWLNDGRV